MKYWNSFNLGLELCKQRILSTNHKDFLPCKETLESVYACYTDHQYDKNILNGPEEIVPHMKGFMDCYFHKTTSLTDCMVNVENGIREVYRKDPSKFVDYC